jgi:hypothetical protein
MAGAIADEAAHRETIVFMRHGEKPKEGLGQLDCQGLNRALALPKILEAKFGKPTALFAPNPSQTKNDGGKDYDYIRPLATIEPAAIKFGLPVDTTYGFAEIDKLKDALEQPALSRRHDLRCLGAQADRRSRETAYDCAWRIGRHGPEMAWIGFR